MNVSLGDIVVIVIKNRSGMSSEVSGQVEGIAVSRYSADAVRLQLYGVGWFDLGLDTNILVSPRRED